MGDKINELIEIRVIFEKAMAAFDKMEKGIDKLGNKLDTMAKKFDEAESKTQKHKNALQLLGGGLTSLGKDLESFGNKLLYLGASWSAGISVPLMRFGQDAVDTFLEVETAWSSMSKVVGLSITDLKAEFGATAKVISEDYGLAQELVIETMNEFIKAGIEEEDQINKLSRVAAETAILFDTDLNTATEIVRQSMQQWGWTANETAIGLSIINEIADRTATSELELAQAFTVASPAARAFGVDIEELGGYIAALQSRGFEARESGNALRTIFQYMSQDADRVSDALAALGVEMSETELNALSGSEKINVLVKAYADFRNEAGFSRESLEEWTGAVDEAGEPVDGFNERMNDVANALGDVVRKRQFPKLIALIDEMADGMDASEDTTSEYAKALDSVNMSSDELTDTWNTKLAGVLDSAPAKWDQLQSRMDNTKAEIGLLIFEAIEPLATKFAELLEKFNNLDPSTKEFLVRMGMIAAAIGPLLITLASLVKVIGFIASTLGPVVSAIGGLISSIGTGPFLLIAAAIAGMVYWIIELGKAFKEHFLDKIKPETIEKIKEVIDTFLKAVGEGFKSIDEEGAEKTWMEKVGEALENLATKINEIDWEQVKKWAEDIGKFIGVAAKIIWIVIKVIGFIALIPVWIGVFAGKIADWIVNTREKIREWYSSVVQAIIGFVTNTWNAITGWVTNTWNAITGWVTNTWNTITTWASNIIAAIVAWGVGIFNAIKSALEPILNLFKAIWDLITGLIELAIVTIVYIVSEAWNTIKSTIETVWNAIWGFLEPIITKIRDWIINAFNNVKDKVIEAVEWIKTKLNEIWTWIKDNVISPIVTWIKDHIITKFTETKDAAVNKIQELANKAKEWFETLKTNIKTKLTELKTTVKEKIDTALQPIKDVVDNALQWGKNLIQNFIDGITSGIENLNKKIDELTEGIKKKIKFQSPPIEGPLSDSDTYMPKFIKLLVDSLDNAAPYLYKKVDEVAMGLSAAMSPQALYAGLEGGALGFTPTLEGGEQFQREMSTRLATPIEAASPNVTQIQVHKHFEVRPGVMIASDAEQREFIRHTQKLEEMENIRTSAEIE